MCEGIISFIFNAKYIQKGEIMAFNLVDFFALVKELIGNEEKMEKFREIIFDIKELVNDIKDAITIFQKV